MEGSQVTNAVCPVRKGAACLLGQDRISISSVSWPESCVGRSVARSAGDAFKWLVLPKWLISMVREIRCIME